MPTLKEIFDDLSVNSLENLSIVNPLTRTIREDQYYKMISHVNRALTVLHKRFMLRTGELVVQQHHSLSRYALHSDFAESNTASTQLIKYIKDTPSNPFQDDIFKIEQVFSELGEEYPINDSNQPYPIYTPEYNVLSMLPVGEDSQTVFVIYRANHPKIVLGPSFNPALVNINIPDSFLDALYARIAAYAYTGVTAESSEVANSPTPSYSYMKQYELECMRLETENVAPNDNNTSTNFEDKGWA